MTPAHYQKKPIVIQAMQATGDFESNRAIIEWAKDSKTPIQLTLNTKGDLQLAVKSLEGLHWINKDDFVIKGVAGEFYACKPHIFYETYDLVENAT